MKKFFTSVAVALASFSFANAQVPSKISYQGVTAKKNQTVQVEFTVCQNNNPIYTETQSLKTNASGLFAAKIGNNNGWDEINWEDGNISVLANVDGILASATEVTTVPYAKVAEGYVGQEYIEQDIANLVIGNRENKTDIGELKNSVAALDNAMEYVSSDVQGIQESLRGKANVTELEATTNLAQSLSEDIYKEGGLAEIIEANMTGVAALNEAMDYVSSDVQGIQESLRGKATVTELEATTNLAQSLSEDIYKEGGLAEIIEANMTGVAANADAIEIVSSDVQGIQESLRGKATVTYVAALDEAIANVSSDVQGIQESLRGKANVDDLNDFKASVENAMENIQALGEYVMGEEEGSVTSQLAALDDAMANVSSDVQGIQESLRGKANVNDVIALKEELEATTNLAQSLSYDLYNEEGTGLAEIVETNKGLIEQIAEIVSEEGQLGQVQLGFSQLSNRVDALDTSVATLDETVFNATNDIQGMQETLRNKANVADVTALQADVENLQSQLIQLSQAFGTLLNLLETKGSLTADELDAINNSGASPINR